MNLYVATEQRFFAHQGQLYAEATGGYDFWQRYLVTFAHVHVVARVQTVATPPAAAVPATGPGVTIIPLPNFYGPAGLWRLPALQRQIVTIARQPHAAYILRVPGTVGTLLGTALRWRKRPFALELVGDPYDSLSPTALQTPWARPVRAFFVRALQQQCRQAIGVAYVTRHALQQRYPATGFTTTYSSIELPDTHFQLAAHLRQSQPRLPHQPLRLIFVGSLAQRYKGLHVLLEALHQCQQQGVGFSLAVLGDGAQRAGYEETAVKLGLAPQVTFHGFVPQGTAVVQQLCQADLFVMPSLVEGLPRALIEAMACGLPAIGTAIGGIPELLPPEALVPRNDAPALAQKLLALHHNQAQLVALGAVNQAIAQEYRAERLQQRRQQFYDQFLRNLHPNLYTS